MILKRLIPYLIIATTLISCNKNRVFEAHQKDFPNYRWDKNNTLKFTPEIQDKESDYKLIIAFRHISGFQLKDVKINVEIINPSGEKVVKDYNLTLYDNQNKLLSNCAGDYCDLETVIENNFKFKETGKYQFKIIHQMEINPIPNVMELGLIIDKIEKQQK